MRAATVRRRLFLESLENRHMLAAAVGSVTLDEGVLSAIGSKKNDQIQICLSDSVLSVRINKQVFQFAAADVAELRIDGGKGNDSIVVGSSVMIAARISGGDGNDRICGGGGDDTISGDQGNDRIGGGGGNDNLSGGRGNDWVDGDDGDDAVHGDEGADQVFGGGGLDELWGDGGNDKLDGGDEDDVLHGGLGKDHLKGGSADDQLFGDEGKDELWGDDGDDQLFGGSENDQLWGGDGDDALKGEAGNDKLDGGGGTNLLDGDEGKNKFKNGTVVDLDEVQQGLVAELIDYSGHGIAGVAKYSTVVVDGVAVQRLTVTLENVPPPQGAPAPLRVVVEEGWVGDITVDALSGKGTLTVDGLFIENGYFISVGSSLVGSFGAS
jgi:Ca2+-binding RTX toxin-like protein